LKKAGTIEPGVFIHMVAKGRGGAKYPKPITRLRRRGRRLRGGRVPGPHPAPSPTDGRAGYGATRGTGTHRDTSDRTQDSERVRALRHRERRRSPVRGGAARRNSCAASRVRTIVIREITRRGQRRANPPPLSPRTTAKAHESFGKDEGTARI
jgi:hypothetical protein